MASANNIENIEPVSTKNVNNQVQVMSNSGTVSTSGGVLAKYNLRTKQTRVEQDRKRTCTKPEVNKKTKSRAAPLSKYRRKTANARERNRMQEINEAFETLKRIMPKSAKEEINESKLTKITTLRLAVNYISALTKMLQMPITDTSNTSNKVSLPPPQTHQPTMKPIVRSGSTSYSTSSNNCSPVVQVTSSNAIACTYKMRLQPQPACTPAQRSAPGTFSVHRRRPQRSQCAPYTLKSTSKCTAPQSLHFTQYTQAGYAHCVPNTPVSSPPLPIAQSVSYNSITEENPLPLLCPSSTTQPICQQYVQPYSPETNSCADSLFSSPSDCTEPMLLEDDYFNYGDLESLFGLEQSSESLDTLLSSSLTNSETSWSSICPSDIC